MTEFGIQASFKTKNDTLVNVRGADPTEFDMYLTHAVEQVEAIHAAEAAFRGLAPQTTEEAVSLVQTVMPGTQVIADYTTPPGPAQQPAYQLTVCGRCKQAPTCKQCNRACEVMPKSVKNGQYWVHDCPSGDRSHKGQWCNEPK